MYMYMYMNMNMNMNMIMNMNMYMYLYISAGPLVGHTAVEDHFRYNVKYQVYKYRYQV